MFLDLLRRRNPRLIEAAIALHQAGRIPANAYVIDLDAVAANARLLADAGRKLGVEVLAMTKQMGRNGSFCRAIQQGGITKAVAVDMECARACARAGLRIGHLGHLVQVPSAEADAGAALEPDYWTVFNTEKAAEAGAAAQRRGRTQKLLARIVAEGDRFYRGHEGGFPADRVVAVADQLDRLPGASFAGITSFPALLFDQATHSVALTPNMRTLAKAADALRQAGRREIVLNTPGTTSSAVMHLLAEVGATQVEPGHGLTGTTPLHAVQDLPELPAVAYVSEVSHHHGAEAYCFGGGLYIDPVFPDYPVRAIVAREPTTAESTLLPVEIPPPAAIDYYGMIDGSARMPAVGDTVVFGFRPQVFVTRAYSVGIAGLASGAPVVDTIHDAFGRPADWP
ncbi:alanine racemase [Geminicoccus flavidas]|uniref:alanine racemase n=1 Tax=Geminicoccus flavidas TaxID=2506407 RepID=UPI001359A955|nr:alanine racemase [Geminicoccus flavidas]